MAIDHNNRLRTFSRRSIIVMGAQGALLAGLVGRLYNLQIMNGDYYEKLAENNRLSTRFVLAPRGLILDRNGKKLADVVRNYQAILLPDQAHQSIGIDSVLDRFQKIIPLSHYDIRKVYHSIDQNHLFFPVVLKENLSWDEIGRISTALPYLPGIEINIDDMRYYPYKDALAHTIGYVSSVARYEALESKNPLLLIPGYRIGKNGLEKEYNIALQGTPGKKNLEVNALGRVLGEASEEKSIPGKNLKTTLHLGLQKFTYNALNRHKAAAAVVMDARNGDILAMASAPSFDSNLFTLGIDSATWKSLLDGPHKPLLNRTIAGQYAPGSTFKPVVALEALKQGVDPKMKVDCKGYIDVGNQRFHCWRKKGHGPVDMHSAIVHSCDVYFYTLAMQIGITGMMDMARLMGFGERKTPYLGLQGERQGFLPSKEWKKRVHHTPWVMGDTVISGIGQGFILATPLQLAVYASRIATGKAVLPRLSREVFDGNRLVSDTAFPEFDSLGIPDEHLEIIRQGMIGVVNEPGGTARGEITGIPGWGFAGKTGTSQVRRITEKERKDGLPSQMSIPWKYRDHALFVAFGPMENPRYAMATIVEHGVGGAEAAAPIAKRIFLEMHSVLPELLEG